MLLKSFLRHKYLTRYDTCRIWVWRICCKLHYRPGGRLGVGLKPFPSQRSWLAKGTGFNQSGVEIHCSYLESVEILARDVLSWKPERSNKV